MDNFENRRNEIQRTIERVTVDIDLAKLELKSYKLMKKSTIMTALVGFLTLFVIGFNISTSEVGIDFLHSVCISAVTATIILQINEIFSQQSNIRKTNFRLKIKNNFLEELKEELERL